MGQEKVLVVCLNPTFQRIMEFPSFHVNEVNRAEAHYLLPSGKGCNVVRFLTLLSRPATLLTYLGGGRSEEFRSLCAKEHIKLECVPTVSPIRTCTTVLDAANHTTTELVEEPEPVEENTDALVWERFQTILPQYDALVITGTRAKGYQDDLYARMVKLAKERGKLVVLDIKGKDLLSAMPYHPDVVKPNLSELMATFFPHEAVLENDDTDALFAQVKAKASTLIEQYGVKLVISRGKADTWTFRREKSSKLPVTPVKVENTIGCGDALTAGLVHKLLDGETFEKAVAFGMECAGRNASHVIYAL